MSLTEDASRVAFILAFASHLDSLKADFDSISEDPSSSIEQCCYVEELSIGLRVVKNYGLRTLASGPEGASVDAACALLNGLLLGSPSKRKLNHLSTAELVSRVDDSEAQVNPLVQDPALLAKLHALLRTAVQTATGSQVPKDSPVLASYISQLLVSYLSAQEAANPQKFSLGGLSSAAMSHLKGNGESPVKVSWEAVYSLFRNLLSLQADLAPYSLARVLETRELGNNLMSNCSYPQALKVYTEAIEGAGFSALNNLPQLYTNRAIAFIGLNCFMEAVSDLQVAVSLDRTFTPAWVQLGYCHLYLGSGLLALKCYLVALRTMAGEIYPLHLPGDVSSKSDYTETKLNTVFPPFVQKLVSSILLTEKRAEQQQEPASSIQEITTRVRAILARLRSYVAAEDVHYLSYAYEADLVSTRATAARANRVRPTILSPDVAQDILASTGVEASAVTVSPPPLASFTTHTIPNRSGSPGSPSSTSGEAAQTETREPSIREMFNNLGEVFAGVIPDRNPAREVISNTETTASDSAASQTRPRAQSESQELDPVSRAIASAQRALAPSQPGNEPFTVGGFEVAGGFSNIISQALRNHQAAYERTRAQNNARTSQSDTQAHANPGVRVTVHHMSHPTSDTNRGTERGERSAERRTDSPRPEDTDMPDAQDLD